MKRTLAILFAGLVALVLAASPSPAQPPPGDYGDAPEGAPAYPWLGVMGNFPTCFGGAVGFIRHAPTQVPLAWFGPTVDFEADGNAGFCPPPPYEQDECWVTVDNDAGLMFPSTFSINAAGPVLCSPAPARALGAVCTPGVWGIDIDARLTNNTDVPVYLNVLVDWDQSGTWGGTTLCGTTVVREQIVVDLPVPPGYAGPVSGLPGVPGFIIGPRDGHVWARMTLTGVQLGPGWDGRGPQIGFNFGETEDYLIFIRAAGQTQSEFGDAPEGVVAYPPTGVLGVFPTCLTVGPVGSHIRHAFPTGNAYFGLSLDLENDGNAGDCAWVGYDRDECNLTDGDAGLFRVGPHTIVGGVIQACPGSNGRPLSPACGPVAWGPDIDIRVVNMTNIDLLANGVADWNQNGAWGGFGCAAGGTREWFLRNFVVPAGYVGPLSALGPPGFFSGAAGFSWARFSLSESPILTNDWDGTGDFLEGETEDYLIAVFDAAGSAPALRGEAAPRLQLAPASPNPFAPATTISWVQASAGPVSVTVHDIQGRVVARLAQGERAVGQHTVPWDGTGVDGRIVQAGMYVLRVETGGQVRTQKLIRSR